MKHKSNIYLTLTCVTLACISLAGCVKELGLTRFGIAVEQYGGGGKLVVTTTTNEGVTSAFVAGDTIRINGQKGVVEGDADGLSVTFSEAVTPVNDKYHALYPASLFTSQGADGSIAVDLPSEYNYEEDGSGNQLIDIPLAAVSENKELLFRHLTGALVFLVSPVANENIVLDYIMVESSGTPLHGTGTVTFVGDDTLTLSLANDPDKRHVTMFFPTAAYATINQGSAPKRILIPVPVVPSDNKFTITVCAHKSGSTVNYYFFHKTQTTGGALARKEVGYVPVENMTFTTKPFIGTGTDDNPYLIKNKEDYRHFLFCVDSVEYMDTKSYSLTSDIDFKGESIQTINGLFKGNFNGGGHKLENVTVNCLASPSYRSTVYASIFPEIAKGTTKNLIIENTILHCNINSDYLYAGGLTFRASSSSTDVVIDSVIVRNLSFSPNSLSSNSILIGGIVGKLTKYGSGSSSFTLKDCECIFNDSCLLSASTSSTITFKYGGLIGFIEQGNTTITNCKVNFARGINIHDHNTNAGRRTYIGGAIGEISSSNTDIMSSTLQGRLWFTGHSSYSNTYNVKKVCASSASTGTINCNTDNLTVKKRQSGSSIWTTVDALY